MRLAKKILIGASVALGCLLAYGIIEWYLDDFIITTDLGDGFEYYPDAYRLSHRTLPDSIMPPLAVESVDYDQIFIVAKQKPPEYRYVGESKINYPLGRDTTYYWLILKKEQKVFGPLDASQFAKLRKQYNVPEKLKVDK